MQKRSSTITNKTSLWQLSLEDRILGELRCEDNSQCYPSSARCDGIQDCQDNSDEQNCLKNKSCGKTLFTELNDEIIFETYETVLKCDWEVRLPQEHGIMLTVCYYSMYFLQWINDACTYPSYEQ